MSETTYRTRQEIFDIAYRGLAAQGFKQSLDRESCAYRGTDGCKCAIGFLIDDLDYSPTIEGVSAANPGVLRNARIAYEYADFARDLQRCHDFNHIAEDMRKALHGFAARHGLTVPQIEEVTV